MAERSAPPPPHNHHVRSTRSRRRSALLRAGGLALALASGSACDRGTTSEDEAETRASASTPGAETTKNRGANAGGAQPEDKKSGPGSVQLPTVATDHATAAYDNTPTLWIAADGVWLGRAASSATRVLELKQARHPADASEWVEPLAVALHALERDPDELIAVGDGPRQEQLQIVADAQTDARTVRRMATVARTVGYGPLRFAVSSEDSLEFRTLSPLEGADTREASALDKLIVELGADGQLALRGESMSTSKLRTALGRQLDVRSGREQCVFLDPDDNVGYETLLQTLASLADVLTQRDFTCVVLRSPLAPADEQKETPPPPPPPPPPASPADALADKATVKEDSASKAEPAPKEAPAPPAAPAAKDTRAPAPHDAAEDRAALIRWSEKASADAEVRDEAACKKLLAKLRSEFEKTDKPQGQAFANLARMEGRCGDKARIRPLLLQRTETYPDDWKAWLSVGQHDYDPLYPDLETGKPYNEDLAPQERRRIATQALASFEKAHALAPKEREPHTWAMMALTQRRFSYATTDGKQAEEARLEEMAFWRYQKKVCDLDGLPDCPQPGLGTCCPPPPMTEEEHAALEAKIKRP